MNRHAGNSTEGNRGSSSLRADKRVRTGVILPVVVCIPVEGNQVNFARGSRRAALGQGHARKREIVPCNRQFEVQNTDVGGGGRQFACAGVVRTRGNRNRAGAVRTHQREGIAGGCTDALPLDTVSAFAHDVFIRRDRQLDRTIGSAGGARPNLGKQIDVSSTCDGNTQPGERNGGP